jgi:hypothetical protein
MEVRNRPLPLYGYLLMPLLMLPQNLPASGPLPPPEDDRSLGFDLRFARNENRLDYGGVNVDTVTQWIGVSWRERYGRRVHLGMFGGYAYTTQTNNPSTAGLELDGYHVGLSLLLSLWERKRATLFTAFDYTYERVDHDEENRHIDIDWHYPRAQLGAIFSLGQGWRFYGGADVGKIDGTERESGTINRTRQFERDTQVGAFGGLDFNLEQDGYVGIELRSGINGGGEIYFKRRF